MPTIKNITLHKVGNKHLDEEIKISKKELSVNDDLKTLLSHYFLSAFKSEEYFHFYHDVNLSLHEVYTYVSNIFENPESLHEQSVNLAKHLYNQSIHPKIKGGEFYAVYFEDCSFNGELFEAVGLFKSENKDTFLEIEQVSDGFDIESRQGININKLDKGCLIFNTEKDNGYVVSIVDNTNKGAEAQYWIDDFLHIQQRKDEYYNTQNLLTLTKNFVTKELPQQFDISKADQADLLNKSVAFFKGNDDFDLNEFANEVIQQQEIIDSFHQYKNNYQQEHEIEIANNFSISESALKKQARIFKSVIKLDKNFHIYIHGNRDLIEQGTDEKGKYYKVYYQKEE